MNWFRKNLSNIIFGLLLVLLIVPQTGKPIRIFLQRLVTFSPAPLDKEDQIQVEGKLFSVRTPDKAHVNLSEISDRPILINFWATWCPPCVAEMPSFVKLYEDYKDDVYFVFVTNEEASVVQPFLDRQEWDLPWAQPVSQVPLELQSRSIPATFILDRNQTIVVKKIGAADWNGNRIRSLLDGLINAEPKP